MKKKILISLLNKFDPAGESEIEGQGNQSNDSIDEEKDTHSTTKTQLKRYSSRNICPCILNFILKMILLKYLFHDLLNQHDIHVDISLCILFSFTWYDLFDARLQECCAGSCIFIC